MLPDAPLLGISHFKGWGLYLPLAQASHFGALLLSSLSLLHIWSISHPDSFLCTLSLEFELLTTSMLMPLCPTPPSLVWITTRGSSFRCPLNSVMGWSWAVLCRLVSPAFDLKQLLFCGAMGPLEDGIWQENSGSWGWTFESCIHLWFWPCWLLLFYCDMSSLLLLWTALLCLLCCDCTLWNHEQR